MAVRHFYVDSNNGTNTGTTDTSSASRETGAMSSLPAGDVYDRLGRVIGITTKPTDGDFIYIADNHSAAYDNGSSPQINTTGAADGVGLQIISVDRNNIENYTPGADDSLNDLADDYLFDNNTFVGGVLLGTNDNVIEILQANSTVRLIDSTLTVSTDSNDIAVRIINKDGSCVTLVNVDVNMGGTASRLLAIDGGCSFLWEGGAITGSNIVDLNDATAVGSSGGASIEIIGVDLSNVTGTLLKTLVSGAADRVLMRLTNVKLNDSLTSLHGTLVTQYHRFEMFNTDDSSDKFYRFYIADGTGAAKNNDSVYVTAGEAWYGGTDHSSIQVDTEALCSHAIPFVFELPAQYVNLAEGTTDTLTIDLATAETLVKHDLAAFLVYPDGTTAVTPVWVSSGPSASGYYGIDPLDTSTAMPASALGSGDWTGSPGANRYELVLDTSGTPGQATAVSVRIEVYKASIGPIYIHPLITVSAT